MNSKEVKNAIERLRSQYDDAYGYSLNDVASAFLGKSHGMGIVSSLKLRDELIELLKQADPETHMELPVDAHGVPINIGDKVDVTKNLRGLTVIGVGTSSINDSDMGALIRDDDGYTWFNARFLRHHHAPTIEDVLREFGDEVKRCCDTEDTIAEYAVRLREVMNND